MSDDRFYTVKEIADTYRVSRQAVYDWISSGQLRAISIGKRVRVPYSALAAFIRDIHPGERVDDNESRAAA